jgi:ABC-2 type transport system permease protein
MRPFIQTLAVMVKELTELLRRPLLVLTLVLGPLLVMIVFGIGSDATFAPPRTLVVLPPGEDRPALFQRYERQFASSMRIEGYTNDEAGARERLRLNTIDAVMIVPPTPEQTIGQGGQVRIQVLYNEIDPLQRGLVPQFMNAMATEVNREIFLQNTRAQQGGIGNATREIDNALRTMDTAIEAAEAGDREGAIQQLDQARATNDRLDAYLDSLGPEAGTLNPLRDRTREQLQEGRDRLDQGESILATPDPRPASERFGLVQARDNLQQLRDSLTQVAQVRPEVLLSPIVVEARYVAALQPDLITYFAPAMLALLIQHTAVSLGALGMVRERLANTFELYAVAPITNLQLLIGKYLAYILFTAAVMGALLAVLIGPFGVPIIGDPWRVALTLSLLTLTSIGMGFLISLLVSSERTAVQYAMLSLLGIVFFSGFALPIESLRQPALTVSYILPATYGSQLLQDIMLRGLPGRDLYIWVLGTLAVVLFVACWLLLRLRTRAN